MYLYLHCICICIVFLRTQLATFSSPRGGRARHSQPTQTRQGKVAENKQNKSLRKNKQIKYKYANTNKGKSPPSPKLGSNGKETLR